MRDNPPLNGPCRRYTSLAVERRACAAAAAQRHYIMPHVPLPLAMSGMNQAADQFAQAPRASSTNRAQDMLLDFLRDHDADCPVCGYNLRALTRPICPECGHELVLTVGAKRLRLGWLLAAVAPGFFSGIAAFFVLIPIVGRLVFGD